MPLRCIPSRCSPKFPPSLQLKPCANVVAAASANSMISGNLRKFAASQTSCAPTWRRSRDSVGKNLSASVQQRLLNVTQESGEDFQYVLMRYGLERLMYRLSRSVYAKEFVVKGAMLLRVWTVEQYRPTKDLDLLGILERSSEELSQIFKDVCTVSVEDDGLVLLSDTVRVREIREDTITTAAGV